MSRSVRPKGKKNDAGKLRWSLLPLRSVESVIAVLEHGAKKYEVDNWKHVPGAETRYIDAAFRHLSARAQGEMRDKESGLPHVAHAAACLLFLLWFDDKTKS